MWIVLVFPQGLFHVVSEGVVPTWPVWGAGDSPRSPHLLWITIWIFVQTKLPFCLFLFSGCVSWGELSITALQMYTVDSEAFFTGCVAQFCKTMTKWKEEVNVKAMVKRLSLFHCGWWTWHCTRNIFRHPNSVCLSLPWKRMPPPYNILPVV